MRHPLCFLVFAIGLACAQAPRELDAGTFVRKSLTVLPAMVDQCPSEDVFLRRREATTKLELVEALAGERRRRIVRWAQEDKSFCESARSELVRQLAGRDYTGLLALKRFDRNDLPAAAMERAVVGVANSGFSGMETRLSSQIGDSLAAVLKAQALIRSGHLGADYQRNSAITTKTKTQDVTEEELALLRGSAFVAALRGHSLDVEPEKDGKHSISVHYDLRLWSFDPVEKTFAALGSWSQQSSNTDASSQAAGAGALPDAMAFQSSLAQLKPFRFTSQILSGNEGSWLRPASRLRVNTGADLQVHRRFEYLETRVQKNGQEKQVVAGYGYLDKEWPSDSAWRLRHLGGIEPYAGLVLDEVPGTTWSPLSLAWVSSEITGRGDTLGPKGEPYARVRAASPLLELRLGVRSNLPGNPAHLHFLFDLPLYVGSVHGDLLEDLGRQSAVDTLDIRSRAPLGPLFGFGLEPGFCLRFPVRRFAFTAGGQVGMRLQAIVLGTEQIETSDGRDVTDRYKDKYKELPREKDKTDFIRNFEFFATLRAGAQFSLTARHGIGVELAWDPLRGRTGWDRDVGDDKDVEFRSVQGPLAGQGRWRLLLQWVFG